MRLGDNLLKQGDIASARLVLKHAAMAGSAHAALELVTGRSSRIDRSRAATRPIATLRSDFIEHKA